MSSDLLSDPNRQVAGGSVLLNAGTDILEDHDAVAGIGELSGVTNVWAVSPVFFVRKGETLFESAEEMVTMAEERGLSLGETALAYEVELLGMTESEAVEEMLRRLQGHGAISRGWPRRRPVGHAAPAAHRIAGLPSRKSRMRSPSAASTPARRHGPWR